VILSNIFLTAGFADVSPAGDMLDFSLRLGLASYQVFFKTVVTERDPPKQRKMAIFR